MCVFCKIIAREIPSYIIYEDDYITAFLDISQSTPGHTLVVPKQHIENILALDDIICENIFKVTTKITKAIEKALSISDFNILSNNGPLAGQTIDHFHIHIIPRYKNDAVIITTPSNKLSDEQLIQMSHSIEQNI